MHARVTLVQGAPEKADDGISQFKELAVPLIKDAAGFKGALLLADRQSGKGLSITLWETEDDMKATEEAVRGAREETARSMGGQAPVVESYEVAVYEMP